MKRWSLVIGLILITGIMAKAQVSPFVISGKVTNLQSVPAAGQSVCVFADSSSYPWSYFDKTLTDSSGNYFFTIQPPSGQLINFTVYVIDCQSYMNQQIIQNNAHNKTVNFSICIPVPPPCTAKYYYKPDSANYKKIFFSDQSSGNMTSWHWSFGDGTYSTARNPHHIYSSDGQYTVCLKISNGRNCSDSFCDYVYVYDDSTIYCQTGFTYKVNNKTVYFQAYSSDSLSTVTYVWDFGDQNSGTGSSPIHTYGSLSCYHVCLTAYAVDANNDTCVSKYCGYVSLGQTAQGLIFGTLSGGNYAVDHALVYLIKYDPADSSLTAIDTANSVDSGRYGMYYFANLPAGHYLVKAALTSASTDYAHLMPTYYGNKLFWNLASYAVVTAQNSTFQADIQMIYGNNPGGPGFIGGKTSQGANFRSGAGDPIANIQVFLLDNSNNPITVQYSKTTGDFGFNSIALGSYKVYAEIPGKMTQPAEVTIDAAKPSVTTVKIIIGEKSITNSIAEQISPLVRAVNSVYPNPAYDNIQIELSVTQTCKVNLSLINSLGQVVMGNDLTLTSGTTAKSLNTSSLPKGIYNLRFSFSDGTVVNRQVVLVR